MDPSGQVVLEFTAKWCGPCKKMKPEVSLLQEEYKDLVFQVIDIEEEEEIADQFQVSSLPTFILIKNGLIQKRIIGARLDLLKDALENVYRQRS
jgi:thiol-disulfide isomerase/thioredoxin